MLQIPPLGPSWRDNVRLCRLCAGLVGLLDPREGPLAFLWSLCDGVHGDDAVKSVIHGCCHVNYSVHI